MLRKTQLYIEGLSAWRAADKLTKGGVGVLSMQKTQKNAVLIEVESKDFKKAFAILRGSCYNVKKVRFRGLSFLRTKCVRRAGLLAGVCFFVLFTLGMQTRVLRIDVTGSGACYGREVREILSRGGITVLGAYPSDTAKMTAEILSLPRVSFCTIGKSGGIVTVEVQVSDDNAVLDSRPLLAPASGRVEELTVVRGTALCAVGDEIAEGAVVVASSEPVGEGTRSVIVIARVKISYGFSREYACAEERQALAQAELDLGELRGIHTEKTEGGWRVEGTAFKSASVNLG